MKRKYIIMAIFIIAGLSLTYLFYYNSKFCYNKGKGGAFMKNPIFKGIGTALVTPMTDDGRIDYAAMERLVQRQLDANIDALIVCATTGEAPTLGDDEHIEIIRFVAQMAKGKAPIIAGTGSNDTAYAIELTKYACEIGYDAMLQRYQGSLNTFVGPTKILISSDTLQVKDYSRYNWTMFDPEHKKERHETVFPEDKKKAFALGEQMVSNSWQ